MRVAADSHSELFLERRTQVSRRSEQKLEQQIAALNTLVDTALTDAAEDVGSVTQSLAKPDQVEIWGVPFSRLTLADTLLCVDRLIARGSPGYFITANLNYNMLSDRHPALKAVNKAASLIVCDGMPMVAYSRWLGKPLPERVAGSDLIYALSKWSAAKGHRIFFLGGAPGVAQRAADKLASRYPGLAVAGVATPPFRPLTAAEETELIDRLRRARPDIVFVALGQPKGELWIAEHYQQIGAPVCVQLGASFDFVAGGVARAPQWMQGAGLEWVYRLMQEPRRLGQRYWQNGCFLMKAVLRDALARHPRA